MVFSTGLPSGVSGPHAVVLQEAAAVLVQQHAALAAAGLGEQRAGAGQAGRVVLHELHVLQRHAGAVGERHAVARLDRAVGGERENAPLRPPPAMITARASKRRIWPLRISIASEARAAPLSTSSSVA
jgi:hypothetical protein